MEILGGVQNYEWGKLGQSSLVSQLWSAVNPSESVQETKPYAELWIGTHPNLPSLVKIGNRTLKSFIDESKCLQGQEYAEFRHDLPFLFKVLSVQKALSIQAHPNKELAQQLNQKWPDLYKDPNHKPELAVALTPFEALCGFRPLEEIKQFLKLVPELCKVVGQTVADNFIAKNNLKECFTSYMNCETQTVKECLKEFSKRTSVLSESEKETQLVPLFESLHSQFPGDIGCFSIFFFNYLKLNVGEAIYLAPNEPHAYLFGDCVECMGCSDNVVRAGLTPKFKDVSTLCSMLTYKSASADANKFQPVKEDKYTLLFKPPVPDFAVAKITIPHRCDESYKLIRRKSPSVLLVINGAGIVNETPISKGTVLFLMPNEEALLHKISSDLLIFQAMANF